MLPAATIDAVLSSILPGTGCSSSSVLPGADAASPAVCTAPLQAGGDVPLPTEDPVVSEPRGADVDPPSSKDGDAEGEEDEAVPETPKRKKRARTLSVGFTEPVVQTDNETPPFHDLLEGAFSS